MEDVKPLGAKAHRCFAHLQVDIGGGGDPRQANAKCKCGGTLFELMVWRLLDSVLRADLLEPAAGLAQPPPAASSSRACPGRCIGNASDAAGIFPTLPLAPLPLTSAFACGGTFPPPASPIELTSRSMAERSSTSDAGSAGAVSRV
eukprot:CAMPEP_0181220806 /NCGR_PEP_ID=MMETSP1096-20121128/29039_1 /TAXON_ID=156174 ORGANISM="Chrysochromulina ericina, Strain CCMP281" /NCGR_SAMPLE_ID=MMETSP1096 /ASSEMBLY_ACC=CAM_ASM_000453 /LENGTH=145 /DNA_ID=CAMNT_0023313345 /DNA_START=278 /DNA_END=714 /DNA_ORIENTATION=-